MKSKPKDQQLSKTEHKKKNEKKKKIKTKKNSRHAPAAPRLLDGEHPFHGGALVRMQPARECTWRRIVTAGGAPCHGGTFHRRFRSSRLPRFPRGL
jgi:hypothetical protein